MDRPRAPLGRFAGAAIAILAVAVTTVIAGAPPTHAKSPDLSFVRDYAVVGDSYSAGEGNPPFDPASGECNRSPLAWPDTVGTARGWRTTNIACAGATTEAFTASFKGQVPQAEALRALDPDLVSVTIGGNDAGFSQVIGACLVGDCASDGSVATAQAFIADKLPDLLEETYSSVAVSAPRAALLVIGYPQLFPREKTPLQGCAWLSDAERTALNDTNEALNDTLARAAKDAGVAFVDVRDSLRGHELCTADSWIHPIGQDPDVNLWAHPIKPGQAAIAATVEKKTRWSPAK